MKLKLKQTSIMRKTTKENLSKNIKVTQSLIPRYVSFRDKNGEVQVGELVSETFYSKIHG